jgi:formate hydrogenlyase subunit 3/multisubunit Na+/H+ antiporter MnhD subunit
VLSLAFVFLIVGYGTKTGLVPLHNWLPDAHAEGPTPVSAVLSGLLLNVALYAIIRCKVLVDGALETRFAGNLMMGFGLLTVVVAGLLPLAPEGRQAPVRLLVDRAHGAHHLRLRHGRPGRQPSPACCT